MFEPFYECARTQNGWQKLRVILLLYMASKNPFESTSSRNIEGNLKSGEEVFSVDNSAFDLAEQHRLWEDLDQVGKTKAMGYLPTDTLMGLVGTEGFVEKINQLARFYQKGGLNSRFYGDHNRANPFSIPNKEFLEGCVDKIIIKEVFANDGTIQYFAVWDEQLLQKLLDENKNVLEQAAWPQDAAGFVDMSHAVTAEPGPLFDLIARAYNDKRYR